MSSVVEQPCTALTQLDSELTYRRVHLLLVSVGQEHHLKTKPLEGCGHVLGVIDGVFEWSGRVAAVANDQGHPAFGESLKGTYGDKGESYNYDSFEAHIGLLTVYVPLQKHQPYNKRNDRQKWSKLSSWKHPRVPTP